MMQATLTHVLEPDMLLNVILTFITMTKTIFLPNPPDLDPTGFYDFP